jgi:hypothetical protein
MIKASFAVELASLPSNSPARAARQLEDHRAWRLVFGVGAFLIIAALFATFAIRVGTHLVTAWWLERLQCAVDWKVDETNWRQWGETSVSYDSRSFFGSRFEDKDLDHLKRLFHVVKLNLAECETITSSGLVRLRELDFLTELNLARLNRYRYARYANPLPPLTDACVQNLQPLGRLETLDLAGNLITNAGMSQIAGMLNLKSLDLEATEVTDAGLVHLSGMKNLKQVHLGGTKVTSTGLNELRLARPDLTIDVAIDPAIEQGLKLRRGQSP